MIDGIERTLGLFHLFLCIMNSIRDVSRSMLVRKRKPEFSEKPDSELLEKEEKESVCSNNLLLQMSRSSSGRELAFSKQELDLFKSVFLNLSNLGRWSEKKSYSDDWWSEILSTYNEMAAREGLPQQASPDNVIHAGVDLHTTFCKERANFEIRKAKSVLYGLPSRDEHLLDIFELCPECKKKVMIFSTALLKIAKIEEYDLETPMEDEELKLFIEQCVKFSKGDLLNGMSLWSRSMWIEFAKKYNELASAKNLSQRSWSEMIQAGRGLQSEFCKQRKVRALGINGEIHVDLEQIFGFCDYCRKRIPIFPKVSNSYSSFLSGSRARSHTTGSRAHSHVSGSRAFEGGRSRSVRQCSRSTHSDYGMVSRAERISKAVELLDLMHREKRINWISFYRLIGYSTTNSGFLWYLCSSDNYETKASRMSMFIGMLPDSVYCESPTASDFDIACKAIDEMLTKKMITENKFASLVHLTGEDEILVWYLASSISLERKFEMMASFIDFNS